MTYSKPINSIEVKTRGGSTFTATEEVMHFKSQKERLDYNRAENLKT